jgi:hypothetical protein
MLLPFSNGGGCRWRGKFVVGAVEDMADERWYEMNEWGDAVWCDH